MIDEPGVYEKIDPAFKVQWLAALRSGTYEQADSALRKFEGGKSWFCCLGVACDLLDPDAWDHEPPPGLDIEGWELGWNDLPANNVDDLGFVNDVTGRKLAGLNDSSGMDFSEIADWIEENL